MSGAGVSVSKNFKQSRTRVAAPVRRRAGRSRLIVALLSACVLLTAGYAATRYDAVRRAAGMRPLLVPAARQQGPLPLAKEYVYAGSRLVATEEPAPTPKPTPAGPAPTNLIATASAISPPAATITVTWDAPSSGAPASYVVERADIRGQFAPVGLPVLAPANSFEDTSASEGAAYLYRVKAVYAGGASGYSNSDLATAVAFTDDPLKPKETRIRAVHLKELRRAVKAVRALVPGLGAAPWAHPDPVSPPQGERRKVFYEDVLDLRDGLDDALRPLDLLSPYPAEPMLARGAKVYAAHFEQIRARVK